MDEVPVDKDVLKQRIEAARALRGLTQVELQKMLEEDGLGKHDAGRLERGELQLRRAHLDALMRHLRMPEWWFTEEDIVLPDSPPDGYLDALEELRRDVLARLDRQVAPEQHRGTPSRTSETSPESDNPEDRPPSS